MVTQKCIVLLFDQHSQSLALVLNILHFFGREFSHLWPPDTSFSALHTTEGRRILNIDGDNSHVDLLLRSGDIRFIRSSCRYSYMFRYTDYGTEFNT